jgi:hypothetical protein
MMTLLPIAAWGWGITNHSVMNGMGSWSVNW